MCGCFSLDSFVKALRYMSSGFFSFTSLRKDHRINEDAELRKDHRINEDAEHQDGAPLDSKTNEDKDRISELPDDALCHILSLVTTKSAVQTSILSKRWRCVWASVPVLQFNQPEFSRVENFINFVNRVLQSREVSDVERFTIVWNQGFDESMATTWLEYAVVRKIRELTLDIRPSKEFRLPAGLLHCSSLKVWHLIAPTKLENIDLEPGQPGVFYHPSILHLPSSSNLKQLKTLNLLHFATSQSNVLGKLISDCPMLEDLSMSISRDDDLDICAPSLKVLRLSCSDQCNDLKINVSAKSLERLCCSFIGIPEVSLKSLHCLVDAHLWKSKLGQDINAERYIAIMRSVCHARALELNGSMIENLPKELGSLCLRFGNLIYLRMDAFLKEDQIQTIIILLHSCPNLEKLVICNTKPELTTLKDHWTPREAHYKGTIDKLKEIKINRFLGDDDELDFVKFLLEKGTVLQKVNILLKKELRDDQNFNKVSQKICTIPRASPTIKVHIC